jgi:hypothetical protein
MMQRSLITLRETIQPALRHFQSITQRGGATSSVIIQRPLERAAPLSCDKPCIDMKFNASSRTPDST